MRDKYVDRRYFKVNQNNQLWQEAIIGLPLGWPICMGSKYSHTI